MASPQKQLEQSYSFAARVGDRLTQERRMTEMGHRAITIGLAKKSVRFPIDSHNKHQNELFVQSVFCP